MKFLIAGSGIGGLTCAHALVQKGHEVCVIERAPQLQPVGAGISLQPNAMQALRYLGLDQRILKIAWPAHSAQVQSSRGKILKRFSFDDYEERYGFLPLTIYRGDLIQSLADSLMEFGKTSVEMELNQTVVSFESTEQSVSIQTSSGHTFEGQALVAADGIHSAIRNQLWGEPALRYSGTTCWRGIVEDPELVSQVTTMTEIWGTGARFGMMRCNAKQVYWFATRDQKDRGVNQLSPQWKSFFDSWPRPTSDLIHSTPQDRIVHTDLVDLQPIPKWGQGRVTLLGDAAHAMTPNFGQGGAQAIEDAVCLGLMVEKKDDLSEAFRSYELLRIPRTSELVRGSWSYGKIAQGSNWFRRLIRNQLMPRLPQRFVDRQLDRQINFEGWLEKQLSES